ncbi:hypothetical protein AB1Y20_003197 [Prymnesium parvum]|uniref:RanBP2-type domain-containing protein n=1 Tax=Prymnesium parvum TaxID=97485 RepID=A0AB34JA40_PRYPA
MLPSGPPRPAPTAAAPSLDARTESQLDMWVEAKRKRDFHTADRIRSELESRGIKPEVARPHVWEPPGAGRVRGAHGRGEALGLPPLPSTFGAGGFGKGQKRSDDAPKLPPGIDTSVGDWHCVACGNWNWARRKECNQCNAAKDGLVNVKGAASGTKRLGEGGGFKEFDEEEDAKRKRRALEHQREKEERKAEKKKCKFCSRFSCIC